MMEIISKNRSMEIIIVIVMDEDDNIVKVINRDSSSCLCIVSRKS